MYKRKKILIDKKFQLKKSAVIIASVFAIIAVIIVCAGSVIIINNRQVKNNNERIMENIGRIRQYMDTQENDYIKDLINPGNKIYDSIGKNGADDAIKEYNSKIDSLNGSISSNESIMKDNTRITKINNWLYLAVICVTVAGIVILFALMIVQTHRTSGPIFLMTRYAKEILNGEKPEMRSLRNKDDLKDFYELFKQMAGRIIELQGKSVKK